MSEKSLSKNTRKNVILLHIAVMCFSFSGVIGRYVQVPAVQVAMGRVICSSLLLLAISLVCKDKLTLDSKKDYGLMIMTGVVMAIHWSSFFQSIQTSSVAIGTISNGRNHLGNDCELYICSDDIVEPVFCQQIQRTYNLSI